MPPMPFAQIRIFFELKKEKENGMIAFYGSIAKKKTFHPEER